MNVTFSKIKPELDLRVPDLSLDKAGSLQLAVQLGFDGCNYCITDPVSDAVMALQTFSFSNVNDFAGLDEKFTQLCRNNELLQAKYKTSTISIVHPRATLMPEELFAKDKAAEYLKLNHYLSEEETAVYEKIGTTGIVNIYAGSKAFTDSLQMLLAGSRTLHYSTVLLTRLLEYTSPEPPRRKVFLHIQKSHFEILVTKGRELLFYNSFKNLTSEDFLYFVMMVFEQLQLPAATTDTILLGEIEQSSALYDIITRYIRNVRLGLSEDSKGEIFPGIPAHFYFCLLNQTQCVS